MRINRSMPSSRLCFARRHAVQIAPKWPKTSTMPTTPSNSTWPIRRTPARSIAGLPIPTKWIDRSLFKISAARAAPWRSPEASPAIISILFVVIPGREVPVPTSTIEPPFISGPHRGAMRAGRGPLGHFKRDRQGPPPRLSTDEGRSTRLHRLDKGSDFIPERLSFFSGQVLNRNSRFETTVGLPLKHPPGQGNLLRLKIEGEVHLGLKDSQLSHFLGGNAAGGNVCDGAVGKRKAGIGDIEIFREYGHANGPNLGHLGGDERENNIDVVDHQIQDHVHIRSPPQKGPDPKRLDESDVSREFHELSGRGIKTLHMTYLENPAFLTCNFDQLIGLAHTLGDRLLHRSIDPAGEELPGNFVVERGRDRHACRIDLTDEPGETVKGTRAIFPGDLLAALGIDIDKSDQFDVVHLGIDPGMMFTEIPYPDDGRPNLFPHRSTPQAQCSPLWPCAGGPACQ